MACFIAKRATSVSGTARRDPLRRAARFQFPYARFNLTASHCGLWFSKSIASDIDFPRQLPDRTIAAAVCSMKTRQGEAGSFEGTLPRFFLFASPILAVARCKLLNGDEPVDFADSAEDFVVDRSIDRK
jgi:hypothetical protein